MPMIALLLSSLNTLQAQNEYSPFTGEDIKKDSVVVSVPLHLLKQANVKMIERNYLLKITAEQDSIIDFKNNYIEQQKNIIEDFQNKIIKVNTLNDVIQKDLDKERKRNKIFMGITGTAIVVALTILIIK